MRTVLVVAALSLASTAAHADISKAWSAARAGLPSDAKIVVGVDFAAVQKTQLFATYFPKLRDKPEVANMLQAIKTACKLDPLTTIQGVVVATAGSEDDGAVYMSLAGTDRTRLSACLQAASQAEADKDGTKVKVTVKQDGAVTELTESKGTAYFGWVGKDVVVIPTHGRDKAALQKWMGGKGALAKGELGKTLGKANTSAPMWGAGLGEKELQPGVTVKGGYGAVKVAGGNVDVDVHGVMGSADQATTMATSANQQLGAAKSGGALPPAVQTMLKSVTVAAAKDEVVVKASVGEKDLIGFLDMAMAMAGK